VWFADRRSMRTTSAPSGLGAFQQTGRYWDSEIVEQWIQGEVSDIMNVFLGKRMAKTEAKNGTKERHRRMVIARLER
jgi:hypothetical protein